MNKTSASGRLQPSVRRNRASDGRVGSQRPARQTGTAPTSQGNPATIPGPRPEAIATRTVARIATTAGTRPPHHRHRAQVRSARGVTISGEQLAEDVYPSVVFFQDTYNTNIEQIFVSGISDVSTVASSLQSQTGAEVKELVKASQLGLGGGSIPKWRMAGVVGALLSTN